MLLDSYEKNGYFYNANFKEATTSGAMMAYRGDMVLIEGEIADDQGRRKPPVAGLIGSVVLADDKIKLLAGSMDDLAQIKELLAKYQGDFAPGMRAVLYVVNIAKPAKVEVDGVEFVLIPMTDGMVWNELADELALEKSDFKGQSSADKVVTVLEAFKDYKPKYETISLDAALAATTDAKRESRGPV